MKAVELLERPVLSEGVTIAPVNTAYTLNTTGVYQDLATRDWALQTCRLAIELAEVEQVECTWYKADFLADPEILQDAIRAALTADVIVVSIYAADELPPALYVWIEAWLPRRLLREGALEALVGVAEPLDSHSVRTHEYLQAVARKGQLDYFSQERRRPVSSRIASSKLITERASSVIQIFPHIQLSDAYFHGGLNE